MDKYYLRVYYGGQQFGGFGVKLAEFEFNSEMELTAACKQFKTNFWTRHLYATPSATGVSLS